MKSFKNLLLLALISLFFIACTKEEEQLNIPVVNILSPTDGESFNAGDTIFIRAEMSGKVDLHGYEVIIANDSAEEEVFHYNAHVHGAEITADTFWINTVNTHSDMTLSITAIGDHAGTKTTESVSFHCMP